MGTNVSLDIPAAMGEEIFDQVFALLQQIDNRYSPYKKDSELSKYQRHEIKASRELQKIEADCQRFEKLTDGYFSAYFAGEFNPTGYVKGWAIKQAGEALKKSGHKTFCLSIGGDILTASDGSKEWNIGIQDPLNRQKILNKLSIFDGAIATSGNYERGQHIVNPISGALADELLSVTVFGSDIIKADVLATALFAAGKAAERLVGHQRGYETLIIDGDGQSHLSSGMQKLLSYSPGSSHS